MPSPFDTDFAAAAGSIDELVAEPVIHYPAGDLAAGATIDAVVDRDNEEMGGVGSGEGPRFDTQSSVRLRRNATLEIDDSVAVTESSGTATRSPSLFEFHGRRWTTVRILARHSGKQKVLVTRLDKLATRRTER